MSLDLEDIKNRSASIQTEKTRGRIPYRRIFWSKETHTSILTWLKYRTRYANKHTLQDKEALFIGTNGGAFGKRLSNHAFCITMRKYSKLAGIPTLNAHSFRHHKGRFIIEKGGSGVDVMNILGHARMESSRPYVRLFGKSLKNKAQKFLD